MKPQFFSKKGPKGRPWAMVTAYDAPTASLLEREGADFILVGDSLGMVILGYPTTAQVTMDEMLHHAKAVRRGAPKSFLIGDLPLKGVEKGPEQVLRSARRFLVEGGMNGVKIEWNRHCLRSVKLLAKNGITVQAHIGLTPQAVKNKKGFKVQGRAATEAAKIFSQALALEKAGASLLLLECVPWPVTQRIAESVKIPVIGIGAGPYCDGQVLVFQDLVGLLENFKPRFVKNYANAAKLFHHAARSFIQEVRESRFPRLVHSFSMERQALKDFHTRTGRGRYAD